MSLGRSHIAWSLAILLFLGNTWIAFYIARTAKPGPPMNVVARSPDETLTQQAFHTVPTESALTYLKAGCCLNLVCKGTDQGSGISAAKQVGACKAVLNVRSCHSTIPGSSEQSHPVLKARFGFESVPVGQFVTGIRLKIGCRSARGELDVTAGQVSREGDVHVRE